MRAAILRELHQPIEVANMPKPTAGPGQVVVQLRAAALNHRDVFTQQGLYPGIKVPVILGSDGAGTVGEIGEGVDPAWQGQEVILNCSHNWGDNPHFYGKDFKILGMPDNGTFAEFIAVHSKYLNRKPAHLSFHEAAALPLVGVTAWRALMTRAGLRTGERVLITGIGGGAALSALQFAVAMGAEVWVTSGSDEKIDRAQSLGAKGGVNYRNPDWLKILMSQTGGGRNGYFDVIVDSAGGPGFAKLIDAAFPGGRIVFYGGTAGNITDIVPAKAFFKQLNIYGTTMGTEQEFAQMIQFVEANLLRPIIDEVLPLDQVGSALRKMEEGKQFGKLVLTIA